MDQGVFYSSAVKEAYFKPVTPPTLNGVSDYLFSGKNRTIHVYAKALSKYKSAGWDRYGTLVGDLEDFIDGIENVNINVNDNLNLNNGEVYDLMGRKVTNLQLGTIYIKNGKKFMR